MKTAKIFWSGRSQVMRLPEEFYFDTDEVRIRRHGACVILEPIPCDWTWLDKVTGTVDEDFERASQERQPPQDRDSIE